MKKFSLLVCFLSICIAVSAQFTENWGLQIQATTTANYSHEGRKIISDANSNVFVLGDYSSDKDSSGHGVGTTQFSVRIHKYNFQGTLLTWAYIPVNGLITNGFNRSSGFGLELDASGNVYVGYSVLNASGNFDVVIASYSNNLIRNWTKTYATGGDDAGVSLKINGNLAIAVVKTTNGGNITYSVVKADNVGTVATLLYSFQANNDIVNSLAVNGTKTYYVAGYSMVSGAKVAMLACISSLGSLKWKSTYNHGSTTGDDYNANLLLGNDGFIYTVGTTYSNAADGNDGMVLQYNTSGILLRNLFLHKSTTDVGSTIANGPSNYVFAACSNTSSVSVYKIQTNGVLSPTLSTTYNPTPTSSYLSISAVSIADMKVAASNNVYLCGTVEGTTSAGNFSSAILGKFGLNGFLFKLLNYQPFVADFGDNYRSVNMGLDGYKNDILLLRNQWGTYSSHATENVDITDFDGGASLRLMQESTLSENSIPEFTVYPNPASEKITVASPLEISTIEISDLTGKIVRTVKVNSVEAQILVSDLNKGLYVCKSTSVDGSVTMKRLVIN